MRPSAPTAGGAFRIFRFRRIVAVVYSAQVNGKLAAGDIAGAQDASRKAKMWAWIAFATGALGGLIYAGLGILGAFTDS